MKEMSARELIVQSLVEMERDQSFLSDVEKAVLDKYAHLSEKDKAFYKKVMDGTIEQRIRIDYVLDLFSSKPVTGLKPLVRAVLRMSTYQLMWMDSVPDRAACNEAASIMARSRLSGLKGFVNGVLRNVARNKDNISYPDEKADPVRYLSVMHSCPGWIVSRLVNDYGRETAEKILRSSLERRPLSVRLRTGSPEADEKLLRAWKEKGIIVTRSPYLTDVWLLTGGGAVNSIPGFADGSFVVQDVGSAMVAKLGIHGDERLVLDLCAAPGGKSMHAADILCKPNDELRKPNDELCKPNVSYDPADPPHVISADVSPGRCELIRENVRRLGLEDVMEVQERDATEPNAEWVGAADAVIVDAPCSGLGVMGHKPDVKYRVTESDLASLTDLQRRILDVAVTYVRPGGRLIYSTCTLFPEENGAQAAYCIDRHGFRDVTAERMAACLTNADAGLKPSGLNDPGLQLIPGIVESDGFYVAVLQKGE